MNDPKTRSRKGAKFIIAMYIRLSVEDAKTDSLSIPNQRLLLGRYIDTLEQNDIEVLEFVDNGYSGTNFERPAVQELLELVRQSRIDCIIVKDFSRFGRNSIEMGYFIEMVFPLFRTRFISVGDNFDTNNFKEDTGGMAVAFQYLIHEYYSKDLSRKTKSSKYAKMKRGEYQSEVCCYGYQKGVDGRLELDPEAAAIVKLIFDLALTMRDAGEIVKALFERNILPPGEYRKTKGIGFHNVSRSIGIWNRSSVLRILTDERHTGTYIIGKRAVTEVGGNRCKMKPESEWFKIPDHHPAIVDRAVFEQVQAKLRHFKCDKQNREYTLRAKVVCGCCRHAMTRATRKEPAFVCRYTKVNAAAECHGLEIGEQELENLLFESISKQAQIILKTDNMAAAKALDLRVMEQAEYEKQIENCNDRKRDLYERFVLKEIDGEQFKAAKSAIDAELNRLTHACAAVSLQVGNMRLDGETKDKTIEAAGCVSKETGLTKALADLLVDKVFIYPDYHVEILWKVTGFSNG